MGTEITMDPWMNFRTLELNYLLTFSRHSGWSVSKAAMDNGLSLSCSVRTHCSRMRWLETCNRAPVNRRPTPMIPNVPVVPFLPGSLRHQLGAVTTTLERIFRCLRCFAEGW